MPAICLITALPSEARPLIEHFRLSALGHKHLRLYQGKLNPNNNNNRSLSSQLPIELYLLQCGVGKLNAATSTATMLQFLPSVTAVINLGICGSGRALGEPLIAHGIQDHASSQLWYPHLPSAKRLENVASVQVLTVDTPCDNYTNNTAFDMEASGVISAALKVMDLAFIHSIKVVSDNHDSSMERITGKSVTALMENSIPVLENLINALPFATLPSQIDVNELNQSLLTRMHFSTTEQHELRQLLQRHKALLGELPSQTSLQQHTTAKAIRRHLTDKLDSVSVSY